MTVQEMTWIVVTQGVLLILIAYAIDIFAKRASDKLDKQHNPGFTYQEDHDAWTCP